MSKKDNINSEDDIKKAFLNEEQSDNVNKESTEYKSLGKATTYARVVNNDDDVELKAIQEKIGYIQLIVDGMPSKGMFYSTDMKIFIRPAKVQEIKDFSTIDETNLFDVDDKLNNILISCCKIEFSNRKGSYKDILEEDRIYVILSIRELTFKNGENKLSLKGICKQCENDNSYELRTNNLQYYDMNEDLVPYYSQEERCYLIQTKSFGIIKMAPPKIGVMKEITSYIRDKEEKKEKWDKAFMQVMPYLVYDWRGFNSTEIFNKLVEFQAWNTQKYSLIYKLAEMMKVGVKSELLNFCEKCGAEVTVPVTFPGGIKSLFIISDITSELL